MVEEVARPGLCSQGGIVGALNREWFELGRAHRGSATRWATQHRALAGCSSLDDVVAAGRRQSDAVLHALLAEVAAGDQLAGRMVLQLLIGRMVEMANRDPAAGVDDYLSALWCRIATYPLAARPTKIAANLSMDALQLVSHERRRLRSGEVTPWPPDQLIAVMDSQRLRQPELTARRVLSAGRHLCLIDQPTTELLISIYLDEWSGDRAARHHKTSPGTVRVRCSRAVTKLAAHAHVLAAC